MIRANFSAYGSYVTDSLYQWDKNQDLAISGLNLSVAPEIHFTNSDMKRAIVRQSTLADGVVTVRIPNSLLQSSLTIKAYVGVYEGETFKVIEKIEIPIIARTKPEDYTIETSDEEIYSFKALENQISNIIANANSTEGNSELVDIRLDYKGNIHASAGGAIRAQILELAELIKTNEVSDEQIENIVKKYLNENSINVAQARITDVTLTASNWIGDNSPFYQVVNVEGVTENSQVDLTPSIEQLTIFYEKDLAFVTENENGVVTVYAIGQKPENDYVIQATVTEVNS